MIVRKEAGVQFSGAESVVHLRSTRPAGSEILQGAGCVTCHQPVGVVFALVQFFSALC